MPLDQATGTLFHQALLDSPNVLDAIELAGQRAGQAAHADGLGAYAVLEVTKQVWQDCLTEATHQAKIYHQQRVANRQHLSLVSN